MHHFHAMISAIRETDKVYRHFVPFGRFGDFENFVRLDTNLGVMSDSGCRCPWTPDLRTGKFRSYRRRHMPSAMSYIPVTARANRRSRCALFDKSVIERWNHQDAENAKREKEMRERTHFVPANTEGKGNGSRPIGRPGWLVSQTAEGLSHFSLGASNLRERTQWGPSRQGCSERDRELISPARRETPNTGAERTQFVGMKWRERTQSRRRISRERTQLCPVISIVPVKTGNSRSTLAQEKAISRERTQFF